jgi:subtilase family serine protease
MIKKVTVGLAVVAAFTFALSSTYFTDAVWANGRRPSIITPIDEARLVTLAGNTHFEANARNDRGRVPDNFPLDHMLLQLKRPPALETQFDQFVESLTDKSSPNFRHWLTAAEQGEKYGLAQEDLDTITGWLQSHGLAVNYVYPNRMVIDFSGTAAEVREAFHTEIHYLEVKGEQHIGNMSDPRIPEALAAGVQGVVSLHNFMPHAIRKSLANPEYTFSGCSGPIVSSTDCYALAPADYQTIYNLTPLYTAGITGKGQTVVTIEDSNSYGTDWKTYQKAFGLTTYGGTLTTVHPDSAGNCTNPGTNADDGEADLDVEMVTAIAPGAAVELASCADTSTTFGGLIALQNILTAAKPPAVISISYAECESESGDASNAAYRSAYQSAATAGVSVFVAAGDTGASICARAFTDGNDYALSGLSVNGLASTPYNVAVGGTDFEDLYNSLEGGAPQSTYWKATNTSTDGSAKSYIPEIPWNDSCASYLIYHLAGYKEPYGTSGLCNSSYTQFVYDQAGGGGPSSCATGAGNADYLYVEDTTCAGYAKPSWQSGTFGNPADGVRDLPDVSVFAGNAYWGHYVINCYSDAANGGISCAGAPNTWDGPGYTSGGTSAATPVMAAIQALVDEKWAIRSGNPNPTYYSVAKTEFGTKGDSTCYSINEPGNSGCVFHDITQGDNDIDCVYNGTVFKADCYTPSGTYGTLGTQAIASLALKSGGSGYTSTPTCTIVAPANLSKYLSPTGTTIYAGGNQATCTATVNATTHVVSKVTLTTVGQGYTGVPACTISGGGGSGARCMAVITPTKPAAAYQPTFGATPGWDMATGIGSVNAYNLVFDSAWK